MMFSPSIGACLLAVLPSQALALPAALTGTADITQAQFHPDVVSSDMCKEVTYTQVATGSAALTADCQALREAANHNYGYWYIDTISSEFKFTLNTTGTCTVVVTNPTVSSDGKTYIGNKDLVQILDHALVGAGKTIEWRGAWNCGGDGSGSSPQWKIKNSGSSDSAPAARGVAAATFVSSKARDIVGSKPQQRRDDADETAPFAPGDVPYTVCGPSTYDDLTDGDSPHWYDCDPIWGFALHHDGEWVLGTGSADWWHLQNATTDKCEFVVQNSDGRPAVGNTDVALILQYIQAEKDRAKGQRAEYKGTLGCGEANTTVNWWMRGKN
ncbi:hypothetical protein PG989_002208 [Apiospora arundinis]